MTPAELRATLAELRWSWRDLAAELGISSHSIPMRWHHTPAPVALWLKRLQAAHRANPPPASWRGVS